MSFLSLILRVSRSLRCIRALFLVMYGILRVLKPMEHLIKGVLDPFLARLVSTSDHRTCCGCLFSDGRARTLGFLSNGRACRGCALGDLVPGGLCALFDILPGYPPVFHVLGLRRWT